MSDKITICLWFAREAEEAAAFYAGLFPGSEVTRVQRAPADSPGNKAGEVLTADFTLAGRGFMALNGGERAPESHAMSLSVACADQAEVDRIWDGLLAHGGTPIQCGWIRDRWGHSWQIVPEALPRLMADPDRAKARRVMEAMLKMVKLDVAALEAAAAG